MLLTKQNGFDYTLIDRTSPDLTQAAQSVIDMQSELVASRESAASQDGFLISHFERDELKDLFWEREARLILCRQGSQNVGYSLLTSIDEFTSLFGVDAAEGDSFSPSMAMNFASMDYFYQLGVSRKFAKCGIGTELVSLAKRHSKKSLLADILIAPVRNDVSIRFFMKHDFKPAGILTLSGYRDFGHLRSEVFVWRK